MHRTDTKSVLALSKPGLRFVPLYAAVIVSLSACDTGCPQEYVLRGNRCVPVGSLTTAGGAGGEESQGAAGDHAMRSEDNALNASGRSGAAAGGTGGGASTGVSAAERVGAGGMSGGAAPASQAGVGDLQAQPAKQGGAAGSTNPAGGAGGSTNPAGGAGGSTNPAGGAGGSVMSQCGNSILDAIEKCDDSSSSKCPTSCDDGDACTVDKLTGSASMCSLACSHVPASPSGAQSDGCCPAGATGTSDQDCRWCATQTIPTGVAAEAYQCLDFENGLPPATTWVPKQTGAGATIDALSSPASVHFKLGANGEAAKLVWTSLGSAPVTQISIAAQIKPGAVPGAIDGVVLNELLCASVGSGRICLSYVYQAPVFSDPSSYTGYLIQESITGGSALTTYCPVDSLNANAWNQVELRIANVDVSSSTEVLLNGKIGGRCSTGFGSDTSASVEFGVGAPPSSQYSIDATYTRIVANVGR